jgi:dihydrofolate synthase/folylpolyglutamate synthase
MSLDWRAALFARRTLGVRLGTQALERVLDELAPGLRERPPFHVTQIVGTNGKGSTAAMLAHGLLRAHPPATRAGPVGLYTSPHLVRVGERVRIDGVAVADADIRAGVEAVARAEARVGVALSFFEVLTAIALERFLAAGCAQVVLEAGLGGRLDATTAIARDQVLIGRIGVDHQQFLGTDLTAIAGEKAAVIRAGMPVRSVEQPEAARAVIEAVARDRGASLEFVEPLARAPVGLLGSHQRHNAALALAGLRRVVATANVELLDGVSWPGRLERRLVNASGGELWLDVAHNQDGVEAVRLALAELELTPTAIVFGALADKPVATMAETLRGVAPLWLVPPTTDASHAVAGLEQAGDRRFSGPADPALLRQLHERLGRGDRILVCGSHQLVGGLLSALSDDAGERSPDPSDPMPRT